MLFSSESIVRCEMLQNANANRVTIFGAFRMLTTKKNTEVKDKLMNFKKNCSKYSMIKTESQHVI
jgi:hypothetical protein